ncbi:hypothetical protein FACS1894162_7320 [Bacteroidia bacterium]|nr:hypothetical protein FACS1894162_7320 [Bacteroidia bacterium]
MVLTAYAQFSDNFSDGAFTGTGRSVNWSGDVDSFTVNTDQQLQLNAPNKADTLQLRTPSTLSFGTSWEFYVKLGFNPSGNNYANVYLMSDSEDLTYKAHKPNGVFVRIGTADKNISLVRARPNMDYRAIIPGKKDRIDLNPVGVRIKATLDNAGNFSLYSKLDNELDFTLEGTGIITSDYVPNPQWFGVVCLFTSSRRNGFYFDDFEVKAFNGTSGIDTPENNQSISIQYPAAGESQYGIHYQLDKAGYTGRLFIYDTLGRLVDTVRNNELLNSQGEISWNSGKLHSGVYIVFLEVFDRSGTVHQIKTPVVVK